MSPPTSVQTFAGRFKQTEDVVVLVACTYLELFLTLLVHCVQVAGRLQNQHLQVLDLERVRVQVLQVLGHTAMIDVNVIGQAILVWPIQSCYCAIHYPQKNTRHTICECVIGLSQTPTNNFRLLT